MIPNKIFIIGLPRTATTSICVAMLELGFKTAHTAYVNKCFEQAQVIADTPVFSHYQALDKLYPNSLFINLARELNVWRPSIRQLLTRMLGNLQRCDGGFNPIIKQAFNQTFTGLSEAKLADDEYLNICYNKHQNQIQQYFRNRPNELLSIDVSQTGSFVKLNQFLTMHALLAKDHSQTDNMCNGFKPINIGGKVTAWQKIKHPLKVESTRHGKIDKLSFV